MPDTVVFDVDEATFQREVVERSREVPVVVDFWAAWCGPCRTLGPLLERSVEARGGDVVLAKVDVDRNPRLAQQFGVRGIPAVKGFRDGRVLDEFTGAQPQQQIDLFLQRLVPSEADTLVAGAVALLDEDPDGAEGALRRALQLEPRHQRAALTLARLLARRAPEEALELLAPHRPAPEAEEVAAVAELAKEGGADVAGLRRQVEGAPEDHEARLGLGRALAANGEYEEAIDQLLHVVRYDGDLRDPAREQLLALFKVIGDGDPLVADARRRLASALF